MIIGLPNMEITFLVKARIRHGATRCKRIEEKWRYLWSYGKGWRIWPIWWSAAKTYNLENYCYYTVAKLKTTLFTYRLSPAPITSLVKYAKLICGKVLTTIGDSWIFYRDLSMRWNVLLQNINIKIPLIYSFLLIACFLYSNFFLSF